MRVNFPFRLEHLEKFTVMTKSEPTKANSEAAEVLLDTDNSLKFLAIPHIENAESEPFEAKSFTEMQTQAWWMYIRAKVADHAQGDCKSPHVSELEAISWLDKMLCKKDESGAFTQRMVPRKYVPAKTLAKVDIALPGSASVYFGGPDLSVLWVVLAGLDDGQAMERFRVLTGLTNKEICDCSPEFLETLLDCYEPISLHTLAAMISTFFRSIESNGRNIHSALCLLNLGLHFELKTQRHRTDDAEICELMANPWYQRALTCLHHNATVGRLFIYGLSRTDLLLTRGKPTIMPPHGHQSAFFTSSNVISTIKLERRDIPHTFASKWMPNMPDDDIEFVTLGQFARFRHNHTK